MGGWRFVLLSALKHMPKQMLQASEERRQTKNFLLETEKKKEELYPHDLFNLN